MGAHATLLDKHHLIGIMLFGNLNTMSGMFGKLNKAHWPHKAISMA